MPLLHFIFLWSHSYGCSFFISFVSENNQQTEVNLVKRFDNWQYNWQDSLEKRMPWLGARQSLLTTSTHSDYSDWGSIISEKKSNNPAPWIYGGMPNPGVIWYWVNEDDCDANRNPGACECFQLQTVNLSVDIISPLSCLVFVSTFSFKKRLSMSACRFHIILNQQFKHLSNSFEDNILGTKFCR